MLRQEFRNLVYPLTEKEKYYKTHPQSARDVSLTFSNSPNSNESSADIYTLSASMESRLHTVSGHHAIFYDGQPVNLDMLKLPIFCCKQTRFSTVPLHRRTFIEMKYIYSGNCTAILNGQRVSMSAGDFLVLEQGSVHQILPAGENDLIFNIQMYRPYFSEYFVQRFESADPVASFLAEAIDDSTKQENYCLFKNRSDDEHDIRFLIETMLCEYLDPSSCYETIIESTMLLLFGKLIQRYRLNLEDESHQNNKSYITEIVDYIKEHCTENPSLEETAKLFNYNSDYLSRMLKKSVNQSYQQLLTLFRLQHAADELIHTTKPIYEIAQDSGFSNLNFFYKKFNESYGMSPSTFRDNEGIK